MLSMKRHLRYPGVVPSCLVAAVILAACGGEDEDAPPETFEGGSVVGDPGPVHVHGLGENPKDGALFIATHTGLFRLESPKSKPVRVADRYQDTMGFTVTGPDRFLGSGHPDGRDGLPPFLGLIESSDSGETWKAVSLQGRADFHVLEELDGYVYGYGSDFNTRESLFMISSDGGRTWQERAAPEPLVALAIDPDDPRTALATGARFLYRTSDGGDSWQPVGEPVAGLSWPAKGSLYSIDARGQVRASDDGGDRWSVRGNAGGEPAAFEATGTEEIYVALHDGIIKRSDDGGRKWAVHYRPGRSP